MESQTQNQNNVLYFAVTISGSIKKGIYKNKTAAVRHFKGSLFSQINDISPLQQYSNKKR